MLPPDVPDLHSPSALGHNGGPPLADGPFKWGTAPIDVYFAWVRAHDAVWKNLSTHTILRRIQCAAELGLTFEEYTSEILFNGRHLSTADVARIGEIKAARHGRH